VTRDIIDAIDQVLGDWSVGPDAMRRAPIVRLDPWPVVEWRSEDLSALADILRLEWRP